MFENLDRELIEAMNVYDEAEDGENPFNDFSGCIEEEKTLDHYDEGKLNN